jgi:hypothetical protein
MDLLKILLDESVPRETDADSDITPDPAALAKAATTPATVASVGRAIHIHTAHCPAIAMVRRLRAYAAILLGAQIVAVFVVLTWGRTILREEFRRAHREAVASSWVVPSAHAAADQPAMSEARK